MCLAAKDLMMQQRIMRSMGYRYLGETSYLLRRRTHFEATSLATFGFTTGILTLGF
jgi:hypothetical protein